MSTAFFSSFWMSLLDRPASGALACFLLQQTSSGEWQLEKAKEGWLCTPHLSWVYRVLLASQTSCLTGSLSSYFSLSSLPIPHLSSLFKSYVSNISEAEAGKP